VVTAGARLAVPGPVWGDRPSRVEPPEDPGRAVPAAPRGAPDGPWARLRARMAAADAGSIARRARARAARLATGDDTRRAARPDAPDRALAEALARLADQGLSPSATSAALAVAGAQMARTVGLVPRRNQYQCAALLLGQRLVELDTGEGKSVAVALAAGVAALTGAPVHVLTANPYLAGRDAHAFAPFFRALGLRVAAVPEEGDDAARRDAWTADVAYAAARTLGFDELRDGLAGGSGAAPLLRGLCVAIIDEADSILLDEARTPLVIARAQPDPQERARAWQALDLARRLVQGRDFDLGAADVPRVTDAGRAMLAALAGDAGGLDIRRRADLVPQALAALHRLRRDVDYLVVDRSIVLVDATTGRAAPQRQLSRELHVLVALKEGVPPPPGSQVQASVTYPRLFARYHHVCGTSGTLAEARHELARDYGLRVVRVERARASRLRREPMRLYASRDTQFDAAVAHARALARTGRCVLVATDSVADSTALAARFAAAGEPPAVLDARHDHDEHERVACAGTAGRITISTQMAGRGTDIRPDAAARAAGGLHVLSLQHNRSRRIDRQLAGRAARQSDPGSAGHWLRLADSPLATELPAPLAWLVGVVRPLARAAGDARGAPGEALAAAILWRLCQRWWWWDDAQMRAQALHHDRRWSRRLHFATIVNPKIRL
jgi:preprotein translocase subunit SecA